MGTLRRVSRGPNVVMNSRSAGLPRRLAEPWEGARTHGNQIKNKRLWATGSLRAAGLPCAVRKRMHTVARLRTRNMLRLVVYVRVDIADDVSIVCTSVESVVLHGRVVYAAIRLLDQVRIEDKFVSGPACVACMPQVNGDHETINVMVAESRSVAGVQVILSAIDDGALGALTKECCGSSGMGGRLGLRLRTTPLQSVLGLRGGR